MTKSDLIKALSDKYDYLPCKLIEESVKHIFEVMVSALANGERIEIRGFGSFSLRYRAARFARNPKTGEVLQIAEKHAVYFRAGKELSVQVNGSEK